MKAWKDSSEILEDVFDTLQRVRAGSVERGQAKIEARLLDTGTRLILHGAPLADAKREVGIKAA